MKSRYGLEIHAAGSADSSGLAQMLTSAGHAVSAQVLAVRLEAIRQASGTVLIAGEWGPPSGVIEVHWRPSLLTDQPVAQITWLLVAPDDRRRGIGRLLLKAAAQAARAAGCGALEILAEARVPDLLDFCYANGFEDDGTRLSRPLRKKNPTPGLTGADSKSSI